VVSGTAQKVGVFIVTTLRTSDFMCDIQILFMHGFNLLCFQEREHVICVGVHATLAFFDSVV